MKNILLKMEAGRAVSGNFRRKACMAALSAAILAGVAAPAVPANAAASGSQTFSAEGSAKVAVTAEVPERVTAEYTVVLPTSVSLEYDSGTGNYAGTLDAGVYGTVDESCAVYTRITADPGSPVNKDASGNYIDGASPDGTQDTDKKITRWYKLSEAEGGSAEYLTAVQDADSGHVMEWVDSEASGVLAPGEAKMAADSGSVGSRAISLLSAELEDGGSYSGNVMVEFGVTDR